MLRKLSLISALLTAALASAPAAAGAYSAIYAFGDSLSDVGNVYIATSGAEPASPYFFGEFSNGPNWIEDLSAKQGLGPVLASSAPVNGTDYAWGGATTGFPATDNPGPTVPNGYQQVKGFLAGQGGSAPSTALYTITLGGNDLSNILTNFLGAAFRDRPPRRKRSRRRRPRRSTSACWSLQARRRSWLPRSETSARPLASLRWARRPRRRGRR